MKKTYQNPEIKVINVTVTHLCDPSIQTYGVNGNSDAMSRESGSFWDDDDEEY